MLPRLQRNYRVLKHEPAAEAARFEAMPYKQLLRPAEELSVARDIEGTTLTCSAEAAHVNATGDIPFFIDASRLPTLLGIKPSYQFKQRKDGTVYY